MVIRGLERYGKRDLARQIAHERPANRRRGLQQTGTVWENYAPDAAKPGTPAKPDFVGWTGIIPILYFFEYGIGLRPDAPKTELTWTITSERRCGCERFRFNGHTATLVATPDTPAKGKLRVSVQSDGPFRLNVEWKGNRVPFNAQKGEGSFVVDAVR